MPFSPLIPKQARRRSIAPRPELLESRRLLAKSVAQVTFTETPSKSVAGTFDLQIVGTSRNDMISITDDGKQAAGSLRITANGTQTFTNQHPIGVVSIATQGGKDKVFYTLAGGLSADTLEGILIGSASRTVGGTKGGGDLQVTANVAGSIPEDSVLSIFAAPDRKGATTLTVNHTGSVDGSLQVGVEPPSGSSPNPKTGPVTFNFNSAATVKGFLLAAAAGGSARNSMGVNYAGTNNGDIDVSESGGGKKDSLAADIRMAAGSNGTVGKVIPAVLTATGATPNVRFTVARGADSTTTTGIVARLVATSKRSVTSHTANVTSQSAGKDSTIS